MADTQPQERPALLDEREEVQNCQADWVVVIAGAAFMGAIVNPILIPLAPALASVFVVSLKHQENAINHILDDPPRPDYATETRARSRRYFVGRFGNSDLALATDAAVVATLRVVAYLEASVRADERAQGARLARDDDSARLRSEEAFAFRERARAADADRAVWLDTLGLAWAAEWNTTPGAYVAAPQGPQVDVRSEIRRAARTAGMVTSGLILPRPEQTQREPAPRLVWEAVESTRRLARSAESFFHDAPSPLAGNIVAQRREPRLPETLQQGLDSREHGDLQSAEDSFRRAADAGSTDAMFELGSIAMQREDLSDAHDWFQRAMELTRAELREPVDRVMKLKIEPALETEERKWLRRGLPEGPERD